MFALFGLIALPHFILIAFGRRDVVPPRFLAGIAWLAGLRMRIEGRPAGERVLLLANHTSWFDILALAVSARSTFVAHGGLAAHGFLKWLCDQNGTIFVARDRRGTVAAQVADVRRALSHRAVAIFPEGTTSDGSRLLPFKSALLSAAQPAAGSAHVAVQPVALLYREPRAIAWFGNEPGPVNVVRMLARLRPIHLTVRFLAPLTGAELADRKVMAAAAHAAIERALTG